MIGLRPVATPRTRTIRTAEILQKTDFDSFASTERMRIHDLSRRQLLTGVAGLSSLLLTPPLFAADGGDGRRLFTLGVASGDPWPDGVVLWTRLAPDPINGGGMAPEPVDVTWELASDERMQQVVRRGTAAAVPEFAHSLHVEIDGLEPGRDYWYRFRTRTEESVVGRTRTAPAPGVLAERLRFALCCCQDYSHGYYTAHRDMANDDIDVVVFLGDYIYEGWPEAGWPRRHNDNDTQSLEDFRNRHALYKTDPDLQANHAAHPFILTWDDHEVDNDYAGLRAGWDMDPQQFIERRTNAYRAYYEHMPLRRASIPNGRDLRLYRNVRFGGLAEFTVLDTRQYRDLQACMVDRSPTCTEHLSLARSIMGMEQETWLFDQFKRSAGRWNFIAQQVPLLKLSLPGQREPMDKWDGYPASRTRLIQSLIDNKTSNPVVLSGDAHQAWAGELKVDFAKPESATIGSEFVCSSISSGSDGQRSQEARQAALNGNPHLKYGNGKRGYMQFELTPNVCRVDFRSPDYVGRPGAPVRTIKSFVMADGNPGLIQA